MLEGYTILDCFISNKKEVGREGVRKKEGREGREGIQATQVGIAFSTIRHSRTILNRTFYPEVVSLWVGL